MKFHAILFFIFRDLLKISKTVYKNSYQIAYRSEDQILSQCLTFIHAMELFKEPRPRWLCL